MSRILSIARRVYGDDTCRLVFEPLVADALGDRRSVTTRLRWYAAVFATFVVCLPRAVFGGVSRRLATEIVGHATVLSALSFIMQWWLGAYLWPRNGVWPPTLATTLPFIVGVTVFRLRRSERPIHQQRLQAIVFAAACIVAVWISAEPSLTLALAYAFAIVFLAFHGWRLIRIQSQSLFGVLVACAIILASFPIKLALGIAIWNAWWPGDNLIPYAIGVVVALTSDVPIGEAGYRKIYGNQTSIFGQDDRRRPQ